MIPALANFKTGLKNSPLHLYAAVAPFVSYLLSAKQVTSGQSEWYTDPMVKNLYLVELNRLITLKT